MSVSEQIEESSESEESKKIVEEVINADIETVGHYHICEITDMRMKEKDDKQPEVALDIDVPYGETEEIFVWEMPYLWDTDESHLAKLAEVNGLGKGNFNELVGKNILMTNVSDNSIDWRYRAQSVEDYRAEYESESDLFLPPNGELKYNIIGAALLLIGAGFSAGYLLAIPALQTATGMMMALITVFLGASFLLSE